MTERYKKIELADFPADSKFDGYYWYSDDHKPVIVNNKKLSTAIFTALPFIIEGNLYSSDQQISIQIKHINGKYHITQIDLSGLDLAAENEGYDIKTYLAHRTEDWAYYKMLEAWKEVTDKNGYLAGMTTLEPAWSAFIGFTNDQKSKK